MYIDASVTGFGVVLLGDNQILALYSMGDSQPFKHSSVAEIEGLIWSLRDFKHLLINKRFMIYTNIYAILRAIKGPNYKEYVLRRLSEIMAWVSQVDFVEGARNHVVDFLSRYPLKICSHRACAPCPLQCISFLLFS